jgi:hypothetical protein
MFSGYFFCINSRTKEILKMDKRGGSELEQASFGGGEAESAFGGGEAQRAFGGGEIEAGAGVS